MKFSKIRTLMVLFSSFLCVGKIHGECSSSTITLTFNSQINKDTKVSIKAQNGVTPTTSEFTLTNNGTPQTVTAGINEAGRGSYGPINVTFSDPIPTTPVFSITTSFRSDPPSSGHFTATGLAPTHVENTNYAVDATRSDCNVNFTVTHKPVEINVSCPDLTAPHTTADNKFQIQSKGYSDHSILSPIRLGVLNIPGSYVGKTISITTTQGIGQYCDTLLNPNNFNKPVTVKIDSFSDNPNQKITLIDQ